MTTLATLKAEIADDLARDDMTDSIASEITAAIKYYQPKPLWFTETRDLTFETVASQAVYSESDDGDIPLFYRLDGGFVVDSANTWTAREISAVEWQNLQDIAANARPYAYARYNSELLLYPTPDKAYTVRLLGHAKLAEPASDTEADNDWMTSGYELIRARATKNVFGKKLQDMEMASMWQISEDDEWGKLTAESNRRKATGLLKVTTF